MAISSSTWCRVFCDVGHAMVGVVPLSCVSLLVVWQSFLLHFVGLCCGARPKVEASAASSYCNVGLLHAYCKALSRGFAQDQNAPSCAFPEVRPGTCKN